MMIEEEDVKVPNPFEKPYEKNADLSVYTSENDVYWKFLEELESNMKSFLSEARSGDLNKAAATRARKLSIVLRKSLAEFRDVSLAHDRLRQRKYTKNNVLSELFLD